MRTVTRLGATITTPKHLLKAQFGAWLARKLVERSMTQSDLARAARLGRDAISSYVRKRSFPEPNSMQAIADAFGLSVEAIMREVDPSPSDACLHYEADGADPALVRLRVNGRIPVELLPQVIALLGPHCRPPASA